MLGFSFWLPKKGFLILEIPSSFDRNSESESSVSAVVSAGKQKMRGFLIDVDKERKISLLKKWDNFNWRKFCRKLWRAKFKPDWKIIISLDPSLAYEVWKPVEFNRELSGVPLSAAELENIFAKAERKSFPGTAEEEFIVIDKRISSLKFDGKQIPDPSGLKVGKIEALSELVFIKQDVFDSLKRFFVFLPNFSFVENSTAQLFTIAKIEGLFSSTETVAGKSICLESGRRVNLLTLDQKNSFFSILKFGGKKYSDITRTRLNWQKENFARTISAVWGIDIISARRIYEAYVKNKVSPRLKSYFNHLLRPIAANLFSEIKSIKEDGEVFMNTSLNLPFYNYSSKPQPQKLLDTGGIVFKEPPLGLLLEKLGFKIDLGEWGLPYHQIFECLAPFLKFYFDGNPNLNQRIRRRLAQHLFQK